MNIILAATGSVATIKYWRLMMALQEIGEVKGVLTERAEFFARKSMTQDVLDNDLVQHLVTEQEEWNWNVIGDPIPHIDLRDWADVLVIAPLSANTLTKMAVGICDNLLTTLYYAWDTDKKIVLAPAMNTYMWENPLTRKHLKMLRERHSFSRPPKQHKDFTKSEDYCNSNKGFVNFDSRPWRTMEKGLFGYKVVMQHLTVVDPVESNLACGVRGVGAMAPLDSIVQKVKEYND